MPDLMLEPEKVDSFHKWIKSNGFNGVFEQLKKRLNILNLYWHFEIPRDEPSEQFQAAAITVGKEIERLLDSQQELGELLLDYWPIERLFESSVAKKLTKIESDLRWTYLSDRDGNPDATMRKEEISRLDELRERFFERDNHRELLGAFHAFWHADWAENCQPPKRDESKASIGTVDKKAALKAIDTWFQAWTEKPSSQADATAQREKVDADATADKESGTAGNANSNDDRPPPHPITELLRHSTKALTDGKKGRLTPVKIDAARKALPKFKKLIESPSSHGAVADGSKAVSFAESNVFTFEEYAAPKREKRVKLHELFTEILAKQDSERTNAEKYFLDVMQTTDEPDYFGMALLERREIENPIRFGSLLLSVDDIEKWSEQIDTIETAEKCFVEISRLPESINSPFHADTVRQMANEVVHEILKGYAVPDVK